MQKEAHDCHGPDGKEIMNSVPMEMPIGFRRPLTMAEQIAQATRHEVSMWAAARGAETFEEADDFDVDDDVDPTSPWELEFDPHTGKEYSKEEKAFLDKKRQEFEYFVAESKKRSRHKGNEGGGRTAPKQKKQLENDEENE